MAPVLEGSKLCSDIKSMACRVTRAEHLTHAEQLTAVATTPKYYQRKILRTGPLFMQMARIATNVYTRLPTTYGLVVVAPDLLATS